MSQELKKILIVDDDEDLHIIVKMCLSTLPGVEVASAYSGEQAIETALQFHPDLILLDVMMPRMDGIATLKAIQLLPNLTHVPVVFLTAKAQKYEVEEYFKLGIADVIVKPFDPNTLGASLLEIWKTWTQKH